MKTTSGLWTIGTLLIGVCCAFPEETSPPARDLRVIIAPQSEVVRVVQPVFYRLVEGSTLVDGCTVCERPTLLVPIRGEFWLVQVGEDPLFTTWEIRGLRFASAAAPFAYEGGGQGEYRCGGEVAVEQQATFDLRVNGAAARFVADLSPSPARLPWIELEARQLDPATPLHVFTLTIVATPWAPVRFSTASSFTSFTLAAAVSDGDLLDSRGSVVGTNGELTAHLGIMPPAPDVGLDAAVFAGGGGTAAMPPRAPEIWFSMAQDVFSETLGQLRHGDVLSDAGRVVRPYEKLLAPFCLQPPLADLGLDALAFDPDGALLFSTGTPFFSECLGAQVGHGDLLRAGGTVFRRNRELLAAFRPAGKTADDLGLDAAYVWPGGEVWFSTAADFEDSRWGHVGHGDLLSDTGHVVMRNRELVANFGPVGDVTDLGLDALDATPAAQVTAFEGCGVIVVGAECPLFSSDAGGLYILENTGGFGPGDRVRVEGVLDTACISYCQQGDGCVEGNSIQSCARLVRRHL